MNKITLGSATKKKVLKVNIGQETYTVPLAGSLTIAEMRKFKEDEDGFTFFRKYIPEEVIDNLTMDDFKALSDAWKNASAETAGASVGE